jgi:hypothetical protein
MLQSVTYFQKSRDPAGAPNVMPFHSCKIPVYYSHITVVRITFDYHVKARLAVVRVPYYRQTH